MNTNGQDPAKGRKLKTLIVTIVAAVVILFVGIWAISSALGSGKKSENGAKTTEISKTTEKEKTEQTGSKPTSPSELLQKAQSQQLAQLKLSSQLSCSVLSHHSLFLTFN